MSSGISGPLLPDPDDQGLNELLDAADARTEELARTRGHVAELDAAGLAAFMNGLAEVLDLVGRAGSYAGLDFATDTTDPARGARMQRVEERATVINTKLLFFELEWAELPDEQVEELLADERLAFARHHLRSERRYRPHLLTEPEEVVLTEKAITGRSAWERLFEEQVSTITVELDGETTTLEAALARLHAPDREVRRTAAEAVTAGLEPGLRTRAFVLNTLLSDKAVDDRLRHFDSVDREPQPRERGERRVGPGARRRGAGPLLDPAAVVRAEGAPARHRPPRRLRPHGVGRRRRGADRLAGGEGARARRVRLVLRASWPTPRTASSTARGSTRRRVRASDRARSARTPCRRTIPTCC